MTQAEKKEVIRVCGPDYDELDIPAYIRNRDRYQDSGIPSLARNFPGITVIEYPIPICQGRDNYASAAADHQERISK